MRFGLLSGIGSLVLFTAACACATAQEKHPHHHLHHALWELRDAHKELKESKADFGGHKEKGLHAIHEATKQVEHILKHHGDNVKGAPTRGDLHEEYKKYKHHPHLHHALHELKHAHHQIKESKHDYGGHREAALRDIHAAITQIEILLKHHKA
jgi:hypothetical protein